MPLTMTTDQLLSDGRPDPSRRLLQSALVRFSDKGYHATTTRELSVGAGLSPAALYVHYSSKEEILFELIRIAHEDSLGILQSQDLSKAPEVCIKKLIVTFVLWHGRHLELARVAQNELTGLSTDHFDFVVKLRRQTESLFRDEIGRGITEGAFEVPNVRYTTLAIMALAIDVVRWMHLDARGPLDQIAEIYADLGLKMLQSSKSQRGTK